MSCTNFVLLETSPVLLCTALYVLPHRFEEGARMVLEAGETTDIEDIVPVRRRPGPPARFLAGSATR